MKSLEITPGLKKLFMMGIVLGVVCLGITFAVSPSRAWHSYILNYYYFMCLGLGGVFFAALQHLTSAGWSATVRRIPEALYSWLPMAAILFIPIFFGGKLVYAWMDPQAVASDHLLQIKTSYLNLPFFIVRAVILFAVWYFVGGKLVRNSIKQDTEGGTSLTTQNSKWSAIFIPLFAIFFSFISVDLLMSLDPHWYSTMFGVNCFANLFLSTIATIIIIVIAMKRKGYFGDSVNDNHIQNLGLLLFGFTVFYAYIAFCQFMLIWYGNLPEETSFYLKRWEHGWSVVALMIIAFKFITPFLLLLPRESKRRMSFLNKMAWLIIVANWVDIFWMVMPTYSVSPFVPALEFGVFLGFMGLFGMTITKFLGKVSVQPLKDPRVQEALHLHQ